MLDPKKRINKNSGSRVPFSPLAFVSLGIEIGPLAELQSWPPVGALLESMIGALHDEDGLTGNELQRLKIWASNFSELRSELRSFYAKCNENTFVTRALWFVLGSSVSRPSSAVERGCAQAWTDAYGYPPSIDLLPSPNQLVSEFRRPHRNQK